MPSKIDIKKCNGCGICLYQCGNYVYRFDPKRYVAYSARPKNCVDCFICEVKCPKKAIQLVPSFARGNK